MSPQARAVADGLGSTLERLDRIVVLVATVCAALFFVALAGSWALTQDVVFLERALAPLTVGGLGAWMLWRKRPRALIQLGVGMAMLVMHVTFLDTAAQPTAMTGLVTMAIAGMLFVHSRVLIYMLVAGLTIFGAGVWWSTADVTPSGRVTAAVSPVLLFVFTTWVMVWMRDQLYAGQRRYRKLSERYGHLFDSAPVAIWEIDISPAEAWLGYARATGVTDLEAYLDENPGIVRTLARRVRITAANRRALEMVGAESVGQAIRHVAEANADLTRRALRSQLLALWEGRADSSEELVLVAADGTVMPVIVQSTIPSPGDRAGSDYLVASTLDLTDQRENEKRLEALIRSKDEFVATVSHELRTPLTAVVGLAEELRTRLDDFDESEIREFTGLIATESNEVANIVEDLLVAARAEVGGLTLQSQEVGLAAEFEAVLATMGRPTVVIDLSGQIVAIGDGSRVRQIIRNLLVNAERYGGPHIRVVGSVAADRAVLEVRDDGAAVPESDHDRIFEAYSRLRSADTVTGSVGLGLTVSRTLARAMGGDLTYHHDGSESVFTLSLPVPSMVAESQPLAAG